MGSITYSGAEQHILTSYFQQVPADFGPFYVGLGNGAAPMDESTTLASIAGREINQTTSSYTTYERQIILRDDSAQGWQLVGDFVQSPELVFFNAGIHCWDPIDFAFLTLSPSGTTSPEVLMAAVGFKNTTILKPGQQLKFHFRFRQTTFNFNYQRIHQGAGSLVGDAFLVPPMFGNSLSGVASAGADADVVFQITTIPMTASALVVGIGGVVITGINGQADAFAATIADANVV